jgi:hypothetical protein
MLWDKLLDGDSDRESATQGSSEDESANAPHAAVENVKKRKGLDFSALSKHGYRARTICRS